MTAIVRRVSDEYLLILVQCSKVRSSQADDLQIIVRSSPDDHLMIANFTADLEVSTVDRLSADAR